MRKTIIATALAGLALAVMSVPVSAAPIVPLSKSVISGPSVVTDVRWRRCWRDRWGRTHCQWGWRDRWGRVICR